MVKGVLEATGLLGWLNANGAGVSAMAAIVTAAIAIVALLLTVRDSRDRTRPVVIVEYQFAPYAPQFLNFTVRNAGQSVARDLLVDLSALDEYQGAQTANSALSCLRRRFKDPIPVLGPGQELTSAVFVNDAGGNKPDVPVEFTVSVRYKGSRIRDWKDYFALRTNVFTEATYLTSDADPSQRLKAINKSIRQLTVAIYKFQAQRRNTTVADLYVQFCDRGSRSGRARDENTGRAATPRPRSSATRRARRSSD